MTHAVPSGHRQVKRWCMWSCHCPMDKLIRWCTGGGPSRLAACPKNLPGRLRASVAALPHGKNRDHPRRCQEHCPATGNATVSPTAKESC